MSTDDGVATAGLTSEQLRAQVRAVLRDVLPAVLTVGDGQRPSAPAPEPVSVRTDDDLDALVRRVATLCEDPRRREAMRDGRHGFRLAEGSRDQPAPTPAATTAATQTVVRVERGAVPERAVRRAAADKARLVLGPRAVLTPLARDSARSLGVDVEREH
jgi:pyruvate/2-oxoglutarate dehydrogenase complex dihydrolipoamide acyltransferase (E2) component